VDPISHDQVQRLSEAVSRYLTVVKGFDASDNQAKLVIIVEPLCRQSPAWFFSQYQIMINIFGDLCNQNHFANIYKFTAPDPKTLQFSGDLIHLIPKSGKKYVYDLFVQ